MKGLRDDVRKALEDNEKVAGMYVTLFLST